MPASETVRLLLRRFGGATTEMLNRVLTPYRLRITELSDIEDGRRAKKHFRGEVTGDIWTTFEQGTTGKVVPLSYVEGSSSWREIVKARILRSFPAYVEGELYFAGPRLAVALAEVKVGDYLEIDPFGVTSKIDLH